MKQNKIEAWNGFWEHHDEDILQSGADYWTSFIWQVGFEFWQEVFTRFSPGKKMLECGAGSARVSLHMARQGYDCTLLDNSSEGLATGKANFEKAGLKGDFVLGDVEKLDFASHIIRLKFRGSIKDSRRNFPFYENSISIKEYGKIARESGLEGVIATGTGMFPPLPLPKQLHKMYAGLIKKMLPVWRKFDRSNSWLAGVWGARYTVYGVKRRA
jgi:ubiquinone/menaquinone biosynthesis C-methylase UbiE